MHSHFKGPLEGYPARLGDLYLGTLVSLPSQVTPNLVALEPPQDFPLCLQLRMLGMLSASLPWDKWVAMVSGMGYWILFILCGGNQPRAGRMKPCWGDSQVPQCSRGKGRAGCRSLLLHRPVFSEMLGSRLDTPFFTVSHLIFVNLTFSPVTPPTCRTCWEDWTSPDTAWVGVFLAQSGHPARQTPPYPSCWRLAGCEVLPGTGFHGGGNSETVMSLCISSATSHTPELLARPDCCSLLAACRNDSALLPGRCPDRSNNLRVSTCCSTR